MVCVSDNSYWSQNCFKTYKQVLMSTRCNNDFNDTKKLTFSFKDTEKLTFSSSQYTDNSSIIC